MRRTQVDSLLPNEGRANSIGGVKEMRPHDGSAVQGVSIEIDEFDQLRTRMEMPRAYEHSPSSIIIMSDRRLDWLGLSGPGPYESGPSLLFFQQIAQRLEHRASCSQSSADLHQKLQSHSVGEYSAKSAL